MTDRFYGEDAPVPVWGWCCMCEEPIYQGDDFIDTNEGPKCEGCATDDDRAHGTKEVAGMSDGMNWDRPIK